MKDTIVLYPALGRGHLLSMIELGKLILTHNSSFSIKILIPTPPNTTNIDTTTFGCDSSITFHHITTASPSTATLPSHLLAFDTCRRSNQNFHHLLQSISKTTNLKAIVMDFMNYSAKEVTNNLDIPTYFYYTSGASTLCVMLNCPTVPKNTENFLIQIPGLPTISSKDMPEAAVDRMIPPVFCIGPVTSAPCVEEDKNGCLSWLDSQPSQSVVLLSFGSLGRFSRNQLKEIAIGLEKSEQRFLWVVRSDSDEESLEELLPQGFLERTKEKGMVVKNWAPQAAILSHDSVGGFVTHCGWNSVLEAVCEGVPMVAFPLYAEQKLNRVVLVEEMKVALALKESKDGFVSATELGNRVKELMDSEKGKEIRERILNMKMSGVEARAQGGSSCVALNGLAELWKEEDHLTLYSPNTPLLHIQ
ncbi:putative isoflavone 7-O-glucosyltransferase [Lupinus albus]|uniref:Glycosyltransferase n=1 Tax=Lupinus albus TaxID=3870 RepID=A0A6A4QUU8_LUPAL|nr:putative isoflavone 7-O-glucosyltransferase [Lupinus albus]